ncbi:MAG TPA: D-alanine--D-alanine ligase, partial [Verrucomicrobiae bacterium]
MSKTLKITVMLGGPSAEREVSLRSGGSVAQALRMLGHEVTELDPRTDAWELVKGTQVVFLALHGTYGEDGTVQQRLDALGVPYTGCDAEASRTGFDKLLTKERFLQAGVPTASFVLLDSPACSWPLGWDPPVVLKPTRQGSSVGLQFVNRVADFSAALTEALRYDSQVLMEERIAGRETTVGILGIETLPVVEVRPKNGAYDYQSKYTAGLTDYLCPAPFDAP